MELRVPCVTRISGFAEKSENPGCLSHQELRVPGVTWNYGLPELPGIRAPEFTGTPVSRIHPERQNSGNGDAGKIVLLNSGFRGFSRNSGFPESQFQLAKNSGNGYTGTGSLRNWGFPYYPKLRVPGIAFSALQNFENEDTGTQSPMEIRVSGVSRKVPGSRSHPELRVPE